MMKLNKTIAILCTIIFVLFNISTAFAATGSVFASGSASQVTVSGKVTDKTCPVNIIVSDLSMGVGVNALSIKYVNQVKPDSNGNWSFKFTVDGDIRNYDIKLRQNGNVEGVTWDKIESFSDRIDADVAAKIIDGYLDIDLNVANPTLTNPNCSLYIAYYGDNDDFIEAIKIPIDGVNGSEKFDYKYHERLLDGAKYVKVFFWADNMVPLTQNVDYVDEEQPEALTFSLPENDALITKNPGKGWIRYVTTESNDSNNTGVDYRPYAEALDGYSRTGYTRFTWEALEPEDDEFTFESDDMDVNTLEAHIRDYAARGMKFSFGVMGLDTSKTEITPQRPSLQTTPKWLFLEKGAEYCTTKGVDTTKGNAEVIIYHPQQADPIYMEEMNELLTHLAAKYDGDPRVEFIDIRSYGNYGEFHEISVPEAKDENKDGKPDDDNYYKTLNLEQKKAHIDMYTNLFKKTQLICATGAFYRNQGGYLDSSYIINSGVGIRNDSGYDIQHEVSHFHGEEPAVSELAPHYLNFKNQYGFNIDAYLKYVKEGKFSYLDIGEWGNSSAAFLYEQEPVIKYLTNKLGYHFVINDVTVPSFVKTGKTFDIDFSWINKGITYLYNDAVIKVALLDSDGKAVATFNSKAIPTENWEPNVSVKDRVSVTMPSSVPAGNYKLAVGICLTDHHNINGDLPDFEIGNYGKTEDGWYVFANAESTGKRINITEYKPTIPEETEVNVTLEEWLVDGTGFSCNSSNVLTYNGSNTASAYCVREVESDKVCNIRFYANVSGPLTVKFVDSNGITMTSYNITKSGNHNVNFDCYDIGTKVMGMNPFRDNKVKIVFEANSATTYAQISNISFTSEPYSEFGENVIFNDYGAEIGYIPYNKANSKISRTTDFFKNGTHSYMLKLINTWSGMSIPLSVDQIMNLEPGSYTAQFDVRMDAFKKVYDSADKKYIITDEIYPITQDMYFSPISVTYYDNSLPVGSSNQAEEICKEPFKPESEWQTVKIDFELKDEHIVEMINHLYDSKGRRNYDTTSVALNFSIGNNSEYVTDASKDVTVYIDDLKITKTK